MNQPLNPKPGPDSRNAFVDAVGAVGIGIAKDGTGEKMTFSGSDQRLSIIIPVKM